jgi:stage II sporulation protein R
MKIWEKSILLGLVLTVLFTFTGFAAGCEDIPNHILRLHVLANSDSQQDQALKLKVRDRILSESGGILDGVKNKANAEKAVSLVIPKIREAAEDEVRRQGYSYAVQVEMTNMYFSTRQYGGVTLPAGAYDALRVTIGSGRGHNWWCVLFPALCLPAAEAPSELDDVLNQSEMRIVQEQGSTNGYEVKFKSVEMYEQFRDWFKQMKPAF